MNDQTKQDDKPQRLLDMAEDVLEEAAAEGKAVRVVDDNGQVTYRGLDEEAA